MIYAGGKEALVRSFDNKIYTAGMTKRVKMVPMVIPPTITMPIWFRASDPAPPPIAKGTAPKTIANVVIKMGRNRI